MKFVMRVHTCLRADGDERRPEYFAAFSAWLAERGFHLSDFLKEDTFGAWWDSLYGPAISADAGTSDQDVQHLFTPGSSLVLRQSMKDFFSGSVDGVTIQARSVERAGDLEGFCFLIVVGHDVDTRAGTPGGCYASVTDRDVYNAGRTAIWNELPILMYDAWHPIFTYTTAYEDEPETDTESARSYRFPYLYDVNIFAPDAVARLGWGRLMATPSAEVSELQDGGIALRPIEKERVAAYLGVAVAPM